MSKFNSSMLLHHFDVSEDDRRIVYKSFKHVNGLKFRQIMQCVLDADMWNDIRPDGYDDIDGLISRCETILSGKFSFPS